MLLKVIAWLAYNNGYICRILKLKWFLLLKDKTEDEFLHPRAKYFSYCFNFLFDKCWLVAAENTKLCMTICLQKVYGIQSKWKQNIGRLLQYNSNCDDSEERQVYES